MELETPLKLFNAQQEIIKLVASESPLQSTLNRICTLIEEMFKPHKGISSILLNVNNRLKHVAAPSLAKGYCELINGLIIGPKVGSCGTAIYHKKRVIVENIQNSDLWNDFKTIAESFQLRACWSTPILSDDKEAIGSFAIYYPKPFKPQPSDLRLIDHFVNLAHLAIEADQKRNERANLITKVKQANERFSAITAVLPDIAFVFDNDGRYIEVHGAGREQLPSSIEQLIGRTVFEVLPRVTASKLHQVIKKTIDTQDKQIVEYEQKVADEHRVFEGRTAVIKHYNEDLKHKTYVLWMARDITDRKVAEQEITRLAYYDHLTDLPNRRLIVDRLKSLIQRTKRSRKISALLFLDLDNFKRINDSMGHTEGDIILIAVKERLLPIIRSADTFARLGGDEFVLLMENLESQPEIATEEAAIVSRKIIESMKKPVSGNYSDYQLSVSIGITLITPETQTEDEALKQADSAMYLSKRQGGNRYSLFDPALQLRLDQQLAIEKDIISALKNDEFCAYFQPQIALSGKVVGAEALIRWKHPDKGLVAPDDFIPIAEQFGLISKLTQIVMQSVCQLLLKLGQSNLIDKDFKISANVSAIEFQSPHILSTLTSANRECEVSCERIKLELTESMLVHDMEATSEQIKQLKKLGFKLSIDDFGTGYSSLNYLHALPIDEIKIDKTFVDKMLTSKSGTAIIDAIISLCISLDINVVAEGVETEIQYDALKQRRVHAMQGFYFARPMPATEFIDWLSNHSVTKAI